MINREQLIQSFLSKTTWSNAERFSLMADASGRSYERLKVGPNSVILMNAPFEAGEDVRPFIAVTEMLLGFGLHPPKILANDVKNGFLLLSDLGDNLFARACISNPESEKAMYSAAVDVLLALHQNPAPQSLQPYDISVYLREAKLLTEWYMHNADSTEFDTISARVFAQIPSNTPTLVMRDYHAENLLWLPDADGLNRVGLLDYQDALAGHPAYDLVSLLEDARRDTSPELRNEMIGRYIDASGIDSGAFRAAYALLGAQRNIKIMGIFARLSLRDGKAHYVDLIGRVWDHLMHDLEHPACAELAAWFHANVPPPSSAHLATLIKST
jgi:aminoglycoside/choline kinase family phosphotransferase